MPYTPPAPPRITVIWHRREKQHKPGIFVPAYGPSHAAYIVTTSNFFKPVRREPWQRSDS